MDQRAARQSRSPAPDTRDRRGVGFGADAGASDCDELGLVLAESFGALPGRAEQLAADFVVRLSKVGQEVRSASLVTNGETTDVMSVLKNRPEFAPVPAVGEPTGETDQADLGLWCGPCTVNLKRKDAVLGSFRYDEVLGRLREELDGLIANRQAAARG